MDRGVQGQVQGNIIARSGMAGVSIKSGVCCVPTVALLMHQPESHTDCKCTDCTVSVVTSNVHFLTDFAAQARSR